MDIQSFARQGFSCRQIAEKTGLDRRTIGKYLKEQELPVYKKVQRISRLKTYQPLIQGWLAQEDFQATRIHDLLKAEGFTGSYDIVKRYVRQLKQQRDQVAFIRFESLPGVQAQVDFGDFQIRMLDGTILTVYCFVLVLGYSRHMYIEFIDQCTLPKFLACHMHAFAFFGGVPAEILYDNMKNVVIRRLAGRVQWNRAFEAFCLHYGFKPLVAPPYAPWVKGKVERPIYYVRERFWRGYSYQSLPQVNADVRSWNDTVAAQRRHGTHHQIVAERFAQERPALGALPQHPYDLSLKFIRKVYKDCQLSFEGNRYVVPHECVGRQVLLRVKDGCLRIFDNERLVAVYRIPEGTGQTMSDPRFYQRLKDDRMQTLRKYRMPSGKARAATRGLLLKDINVDVMRRSLAVYAEVAL